MRRRPTPRASSPGSARPATGRSNELIAGGGAPEHRALALARKPIQVKKRMSEQRIAGKGSYGWTAAFQVEYVGNECILTVKVRLKPKPGVTQAEIDTVKADTEAAFRRYWDEKFYLDDTKTSERFFLRVKLEWWRPAST